MVILKASILASSLIALATRASAQLAQACDPSNNVCFRLNIPQRTASSGNGDIFFQISAPSNYEWAALGQGNGMVGANIFVIYTSAGGTNVTLSPRLATGYRTPAFNGDAQVALLEGSGVTDGKMVANVRCSNCRSWSGGEADFTAAQGDWIYAYHTSGGSKNSDDVNANIQQHDSQQPFNWDYANAKGGDSVNPLLNAGVGGGSGATSCVPRPTGTSAGAGAPTQTDDDDDDHPRSRNGRPTQYGGWPTASPTAGWGNPHDKRQEINYCDDDTSRGGFTPIGVSGPMRNQRKMLIAHGTLAALAFVILFPTGAIAMRLLSFHGLIWFHAAWQIFTYLVYIAGFGLGVYLASEMELLNNSHPIIGIVLFIALFFMPIFGLLHHSNFKKYGRRTFWSHAHLWLGRVVITLGMINGGMGLRLADRMNMSSRAGIIAYSVVAGIMWLAWVVSSILGERRRRTARAGQPPKYTDHSSREDTALRDVHPENGHYAPK